jgi:hypothetical protein
MANRTMVIMEVVATTMEVVMMAVVISRPNMQLLGCRRRVCGYLNISVFHIGPTLIIKTMTDFTTPFVLGPFMVFGFESYICTTWYAGYDCSLESTSKVSSD